MKKFNWKPDISQKEVRSHHFSVIDDKFEIYFCFLFFWIVLFKLLVDGIYIKLRYVIVNESNATLAT